MKFRVEGFDKDSVEAEHLAHAASLVQQDLPKGKVASVVGGGVMVKEIVFG